MALQNRLSDLCERQLTRCIERVLDRYSLSNDHLLIEQLSISVSTLGSGELEDKLPELTALALEKELYRLSNGKQAGTAIPTEGVRRMSTSESIIEAFIYFLKTGTLPWSFSVNDGGVAGHPYRGTGGSTQSPTLPTQNDLEKMVVATLQNTQKTGGELGRDEILQALTDHSARKRLVRQFSPQLLIKVLELLSPADGIELGKAISLIRRLDTPPTSSAAFERSIFETAFSSVAAGRRFSARDLITSARVPAAAKKHLEVAGTSSKPGEHLAGKTLKTSASERQDLLTDSHPNIKESEKGTGNQRFASEQSGKKTSRYKSRRGLSRSTDESGRLSGRAKLRNADRISGMRSAGMRQRNVKQDVPTVTIEDNYLNNEIRTETLLKPVNNAGELSYPEKGVRRQFKKGAKKPPEIEQSSKAQTERSIFSAVVHPDLDTGFHVDNAGLVILHPFLPQLFSGLGISNEDGLIKPERALCLFHYLGAGRDTAPEYELILPKILCSVPLIEPVESQVYLTNEEKREADVLLQTVIRYWEVLRNTSPDGLRSAFLLRHGKISRRDNDYVLQIESNASDILLNHLPWGISIVKLPWMNRMLHVEWQ